jgi:hypothetical protein
MDYFQYRRSPPEDVKSSPPSQPGRASSNLRLVNLALGLAAIVALPGGFSWLWELVTARWLLPSVVQTLPRFTVACANLAVMLASPAATLMVLFTVTGMHRKRVAQTTWRRAAGLAAVWLAYVAWILAGHLLLTETYRKSAEAAWAVQGMVSLAVAPVFIGAMGMALVSASRELKEIMRAESLPNQSPASLLVWAVLLPIVLAAPLLLDSSRPLARSVAEQDSFEVLCRDVGVSLMERPSGPVRSLAYDWDPQRLEYGRPQFDRFELDAHGRIGAMGGFPLPRSDEHAKKLDFDFTESRVPDGRSGAATINPGAPYYHFPAFRLRQPYYGVDALSADVVLHIDVSHPDELRKARSRQGVVRYELTLTDRRSGDVLGVQRFVVDQVNRRACGANVDGNISQDAFIHDAIHR